jgi:hypothetical protein
VMGMSLLVCLSIKQVDYTVAFTHTAINPDPEWYTMTARE